MDEIEKYTDSEGREYTKDSLITGIVKVATLYESVFDFGDISIDTLKKLSGTALTNQNAWNNALARFCHILGLNIVGQIVIQANVIIESGNFNYWYELGRGQGKPYGKPEGPYGQVYFGRGPIQVTWYDNYRTIYNDFFKKNGLSEFDIVKDPNLAVRPDIGSYLSIGWLAVTSNGKKAIKAANAGNVKSCREAINGGYTHLKECQAYAKLLADEANVKIHLDK